MLIAVLAAGGGYWLRGRAVPSGAESPARAEPNTARVVQSKLDLIVKARGIVKPAPNALVRIGFPMPKDVSRRIKTMDVVEGDAVKAGQILAELDDADLQATLEQLRADAAVTEKRLEAARTLEPVEVSLAATVRDQAKAQADLSQLNFARAEKLRPSGAVTQDTFDAARTDLQVTQAKLENAEASRQQVKAKFKTDIATLQAQIELANAAIANVKVQTAWSTIRSPMDGVVFAVHQRPGELTSNAPGNPILTLLALEQLQVHLYVDEADFGQVRLGQRVNLRLEAHAGETVQGTIVRLLPQPILQENVVYYLAVVEVDEAKRSLLRSDMTALGYVQVGNDEPALWLPIGAVKSNAGGWYVRRRMPSGVVDVPVQVGARSEGRVEIRSGLADGDEVLLD